VLRATPHVFVVGGVDPDEAAATVAERLGGLAPLDESAAVPPAPPWPDVSMVQEEQRQKAQTAIAIGFPGVTRNDPDVYALRLLSSAVAGLGGRLFEELRSRRSLAYHVAAYPVARWRGGAFVGYIGTSPERGKEAREALLAELVRCGRERLPEDELERAKTYTIGAWQIRQQTNGAQIADLIDAMLLGEGVDELRTFEQHVRGVTAERIADVAARLLDPARAVYGIVQGAGGAR
jgi:zinc protease